jgi:hypothetical protein
MWSLSVTIGDEDGTDVKTNFEVDRYRYFDLLHEAPITEDYLLAIEAEEDRTLHSCILVNKTNFALEAVIETPPVEMDITLRSKTSQQIFIFFS